MKSQRILALAVAAGAASSCLSQAANSVQKATAQASPTVISQDPLTRQIMLSLTLPNGGIRSFAMDKEKTVEIVAAGSDPLLPLKPAAGLVRAKSANAPAKAKTPKALPQLESVAAKKSSL